MSLFLTVLFFLAPRPALASYRGSVERERASVPASDCRRAAAVEDTLALLGSEIDRRARRVRKQSRCA